MADTQLTYSDAVIMKALLSKDFSLIGGAFEDSELTAIKKCAFQGAGATLTKLVLPSITAIPSGALRDCTGLTTLDITWGEILTMGGDALRGARLPNGALTLSKLSSMGDGVFAGCTQLTSFSAPLMTSSGGTDATYGTAQQGVFRDCTGLTTVNLPSLRTTSQYFFRCCTNLTSVTFTGLTQIGGFTFQNCTGLTKLKFPAAVTNISGNAFNGCTNLTAVIFPNITSVPSATTASFTGSPILNGTCYVYVPESLLASVKSASNWTAISDMIRACEDYPEICA